MAQTFKLQVPYITQFQSGIFRKYVLGKTNEDPALRKSPGVVQCAAVSNDPSYRLTLFRFRLKKFVSIRVPLDNLEFPVPRGEPMQTPFHVSLSLKL